MNDHTAAVRRLFAEFDRVEVERNERDSITLVRLTLYDETLLSTKRWRSHVNLSSQRSEKLLKHRDGQLRFYGRNGDRRNR